MKNNRKDSLTYNFLQCFPTENRACLPNAWILDLALWLWSIEWCGWTSSYAFVEYQSYGAFDVSGCFCFINVFLISLRGDFPGGLLFLWPGHRMTAHRTNMSLYLSEDLYSDSQIKVQQPCYSLHFSCSSAKQSSHK